MSNSFRVNFFPHSSLTPPLDDGATLRLERTQAFLHGTDRTTRQPTEFSGQLDITSSSSVATFNQRDGNSLSVPLVFQSFPIVETSGRLMVGAFYEAGLAPAIPPDDVGSYVAVEPDTNDEG